MGFKWTDEQKQVINSRHGNLLVSAAAGSGKTAVLVERIIEMIMGIDADGNRISDGIDVDELLVVTFTRAAAAQMKEKITAALEKLADENPENEHLVKQVSLVQRADITTIDGFCLGIVKEYFNVINIDSSFDIADKEEMELIKNDVFDEVLGEYYEEGKPEFLQLVDCFARKVSDETIKKSVFKICDVASSYPKPEKWVQEAIDALNINTKEELEKTKWYVGFLKTFKKIIGSCLNTAYECEKICNEPGGPEGYLDNIKSDIELMEELYNATGIDDIIAHMGDFTRLKSVKKDTYEKQSIIKDSRDMYKKAVNAIKNDLLSTDEILAEIKLMAEPLNALLMLTLSYLDRLKGTKRSKNLYEFRDISEFAYDILCAETDTGEVEPSDIGLQVSLRYREIFIDEYQDSSYLQEDILNCVSGHGEKINNMFMVGDVKQSIYSFRRTRPDLFLKKYNTYTDEVSENRKILLSSNFRSSQNIVDTVNMIFKALMTENLGGISYDDAASLKHGREEVYDAVNKTEIVIVKNDCKNEENERTHDEMEAEFIANKIYELVNGKDPLYIPDEKSEEKNKLRKIQYSDVVILMRSVKKNSQVYEEAFAKRGIPLIVESEGGYFDAIEVSTLLSMLAVIDNVHQDYELAAVLRSPLAYISEKTLAHIVGIYNRDFKDIDKKQSDNSSLYDKIVHYVGLSDDPDYPDYEGYPDNQKLYKFLEMLGYLKDNKNYMSISDIIYYILNETGYYWFVGAMTQGKRRQANIDMLISRAHSYEKTSFKGLFNFLRYMEKLQVNDQDFSESSLMGESENAVSMTTMHKSKGIEYPVVFVSGTGSKIKKNDKPKFEPQKNTVQIPIVVNSDTYISGDAIDLKHRAKKKTFVKKCMTDLMMRDNMAEEIRILYVALTRAREKLYITASIDYDEEKPDKAFNFSDLISYDGRVSYNDKISAGCFMDWIMMALAVSGDCEDKIIKQEIFASKIPGCQLNPDKEDITKDNIITASKNRELYDKYREKLDFTYKYKNAAVIKNKMSVTEIKRMSQHGEENEGTQIFTYSKKDDVPVLKSRITKESVKGNEYGTVIHKIMELIDFEKTNSDDVGQQISSYFEKGIIPNEFAGRIKPEKICNMINSGIGRRMASADSMGELYRERQFYMGMKPGEISSDFAGNEDTVVVQGIIDAYFIEDGEIVLLDYKTDRVKRIEDLVERYHVQLELYAKTLERLTGMKVKEKIIYAFHFDDYIAL